MIMPSITRCGSSSMRMRSLNVPGSDSSALQTIYLGWPGALAAPSHLMPVGNAAPPRPTKPAAFTSARTAWRRHRQGFFESGITAARLVVGKRSGMALAAIARQNANVAADQALWFVRVQRADRCSLLGVGMTDSGFADKQCGCVVAQSQTGGMFDGECAIRADFTGLDLQVAAQRVRHRIGPGKGAHRRAAYPHHGPAHRLAVEHLVKIDDTIDIGERHAQSAAHFGRDRFGKPAIEIAERHARRAGAPGGLAAPTRQGASAGE